MAAGHGTPFATLVLPNTTIAPPHVGFPLPLVFPNFPPTPRRSVVEAGGGGQRAGERHDGRREEEEKGEGEVYWELLTGSGEAGRRRGRL